MGSASRAASGGAGPVGERALSTRFALDRRVCGPFWGAASRSGPRAPRAGPDKRVLALVHDNARYVKLTGASSYRLFPATAAAAQVVCPLFTLASSR